MEWMKDIKAVIFDLDGTLYQDLAFHDRYLRYMIEETFWEKDYDLILDSIEEVFAGNHSFKMGEYYLNEETTACKTVEELITFSGIEKVKENDDQNYLYGGDAWSILGIYSVRMSIPPDKRYEAFAKVRKEMLEAPFQIEKHIGLFELIGSLDSMKRKVLMTNSFTQSGQEFTGFLGVINLFDEIHYDAKKPVGIREVIRAIQTREGLQASEILSVGDHAWNDLLPAKEAGCHTVFVNPYNCLGSESWDLTVKNLDELAEVLKPLQEHSKALV